MTVPATRSLEAVLRTAVAPRNTLRVIAAEYAGTPPADNRHANVIINGQTLTLPNLNGVPAGTIGDVCYVLADDTRMWVLGSVTPTSGTVGPPGPVTFIAKPGPPTAADGVNGAVYLDTTSLRMWGPKNAGAWPASAFARLVPLNPTYAQIRTG